jgi:hypothetical protein
MNVKTVVALSFATFGLTFARASERPELVRGHLELRGASADLARDLGALGGTSSAPVWAGYAVPMIAGSHHLCGGSVVDLDSDRDHDSWHDRGYASTLFVLYRVEEGRVMGLRALSPGCRIDAGDRALLWWEPLSPSESLEELESLVSSSDEDLRDEAVRAIALHAETAADDILDRLASDGPNRDVREKAIFWLGAARLEGGFRKLTALVDREADSELREKIVFALHVSKAEGAVAKLIEIARSDKSSDVRERALFWLAQRAGKEAASAIAEAVQEDPELEVKKKAVFALSQLPPDEGVPLLIEVAEKHPQPEVRKRAFFWLGQSNDPRALALFERVLLGKR